MKLRFLILFSLLIVASAHAQKSQNIYFLKNNGDQVETKAKADFIRIIEEPDSGDTRFKLFEFYNNDKRKTLGYLTSFDPKLVYDGIVIGYDSLGKRSETTSYQNGIPFGTSTYYHPNGKIKRQIEYVPTNPSINQMIGTNSSLTNFILNTNSKLIFDADSSGKVNIENGKGHFKEVIKYKEFEKVEEGDYLDGMKIGLWTGYDTKANYTFKENYEANKLVSGESIKNGVTYKYTASMQPPEYKGGINAWNRFIASTTKYPAEALKNRIRGTVKTSFVVDSTGKVVDIKVEKSIDPLLDEEAKRVLRYAFKWEPGRERGIPVRVKYNQSFNFDF
ncbi:energy transducer TonB [Pedobacter sp. R20-19]|uniref:energy transducer TonB n=1 Tax=Pedobacter sp. R20-19 TaxID=1270196 RepID=UPI0004933615|nr:energy transducer TonB [Pedobacter sp. R20-19]